MIENKKKNKSKNKRTFLLNIEVEEVVKTEMGLAGVDILIVRKPATCRNYEKVVDKILKDFKIEMKEYLEDD